MGRLPAQWAGRVINDRYPYAIPGELLLTTGQLAQQYPDSTFLHAADKPFEIHRMIPRVIALDVNQVVLSPQPEQDLLAALVRTRITNLGITQPLTKAPTLISALTKGSAERTWEWAEPQTLERSQELQIVLDALAFPAALLASVTYLRVAIIFEGFLLQVAPASDNR